MNGFRRQISRIGNEDADRDLDIRVIDSTLDPLHNLRQNNSDRYAGSAQINESGKSRTETRRLPVDHYCRSELQREQSGRVVEQAFALEYVDNSFGQSHTLGNRRSRDRVGCGYSRSEHESNAPIEAGKEP